MSRSIRLMIALLVAVLIQAPAARADDVSGIWLTAAGDAKIRISPCDDRLCGVIVWLKKSIDPTTGKPQIDDKNADRALAHRPIIGINIFSTMRSVARNKWSGRIYNADDGKIYSSDLHLASATKLEVRGCVMAILCGGETWTKVGDITVASANP